MTALPVHTHSFNPDENDAPDPHDQYWGAAHYTVDDLTAVVNHLSQQVSTDLAVVSP